MIFNESIVLQIHKRSLPVTSLSKSHKEAVAVIYCIDWLFKHFLIVNNGALVIIEDWIFPIYVNKMSEHYPF